jgi:hypothetical protein
MAPKPPTQEALIKREFDITESAKELGLDPFFAICKDRDERYREFLAAMSVPEELEAWVGQMKHRFTKEFEVGKKTVDVVPEECQVWHNPFPLPWLVGLLVLLYGEHEYFWPKTFGEVEIQRAEQWLDGSKPPRGNEVRGCYVVPKGGE